MCLATVYEEKKDKDNIICRNITKIDFEGDTIKLTDIMGEETSYKGSIVSAELSGGTVILRRTEGAA